MLHFQCRAYLLFVTTLCCISFSALPMYGQAHTAGRIVLNWSDDLLEWAGSRGIIVSKEVVKGATTAGTRSWDDFAQTPTGIYVPKSLLAAPKPTLIESVSLVGKVSGGEIARVWGIPITVGEIDVFKLASPIFMGGAYCIGANCAEHVKEPSLQDQLKLLSGIQEVIVIDCQFYPCFIYLVTT